MTSRASPTAASHAANTRIIIGIMKASGNWEFSEINELIRKSESIMPSKHSSVDIR